MTKKYLKLEVLKTGDVQRQTWKKKKANIHGIQVDMHDKEYHEGFFLLEGKEICCKRRRYAS
jgi:hypothetical protein